MADSANEPWRAGWAPLKSAAFRSLFIAALVSNIGTWMQTVGAQWFLVIEHADPTVVALVQTASLSPTLILTVFAGALADRMDRRRLLILVQIYAAIAAAVLTVVAAAGMLEPLTLLILMFAVGCAGALTTPAWQAIQPELVPRDQMPAAASLGGVAADAARAIGPPVAGLLVAFIGPAAVFGLNALSFVAVVLALISWKRPVSVAAPEAATEPGVGGFGFLWRSEEGRRILLSSAVFAFPASALWALLPLVAHDEWGLRAIGYGAVLGTVGVGAVCGGFVMPRIRAKIPPALILPMAAAVTAVGLFAAAYFPLWAAVPLLLLTGVAWIAVLTTLTVAAQLLLPQWVRARGLAVFLVVLIGAQAFGSLLWGVLATRSGLATSLTVAAVLLIAAAVSSLAGRGRRTS
ncbi:MFS family permease [Mycolicibacterium sp. BK634]|uniref:MFS transporter n=1 Tax=Mycobacteriaceae TaxID=1762 RepID=UPI0010604352|nr:MFS transporter [Mycobacterium sp. BK086]MBB3750157.1 MFS family permease [Mycolicibacterium sp. BK634]TDO18574.1 putative MFS family arabinose efflux permease [Mycobacterium sp. BK086]